MVWKKRKKRSGKIRENKEMTDPGGRKVSDPCHLKGGRIQCASLYGFTSILSNTAMTARHEDEIRDCAKRMPDIVKAVR